MIVKFLVKIKYANIINIINNKEVIPELIQSECNSKEIFKSVVYFLKNPALMDKQINQVNNTLNDIGLQAMNYGIIDTTTGTIKQ